MLDAIEKLAEAAADQGIPSLVILFRFETNKEVDDLYDALGEPVATVGARFERPHDETTGGLDIGITQRVAKTSVHGAQILISGPYRVQGRRAA
jgi:hypothetical protein